MCGICGEVRFDEQPVQQNILQAMLSKLERRGPDAEGLWLKNNIAFAHRRLSVIDLSADSNQPMVDEELQLTLVFNGAIYNYPELRAQFIKEGYKFKSHGDTEVILKAYHKWGEHCPEYLHGMFAFAIWDWKKQSLFLARDRMGIKPLYYSFTNNQLRFASNIQALLASNKIDKAIDTSINPVGLHNQFTLHAVIPAPNTILNGIQKLEPSTTLTIKNKTDYKTQRYWQYDATRPDTEMSENEWVDAIHNSLREAVRKRLDVADVPVGVLLSGGLDSSLLVGLLAEAGVKDIRTFSIGFEDQPEEKGSEFEFSDAVVERYQTQHQKIQIPNAEVLKRLPEAVQAMSEPMVGQDAVAFYLLSEQVSKHVKVVQSGQGADEVFAGYFWFPRIQQDDLTQGVERFAKYYFDRDHAEFLETVSEDYRGDDYTSKIIQDLLARPQADTFIDRVLHMDVNTLVVDDPVKRVDNMTMAFGLEARVPFLDHHLVELAAKMPPEMKLQSGGKHILKKIARGIVPDSVIDRPKGYFPMPALKYVRGEFLEFMQDILNSSACLNRGIYNRTYVDKLLKKPDEYFTRLQGSKLWHLALLEYWLQMHVD
ncbi:Asparagine synthetase [glutamine-hydrolyzing] [hydrothermal vent metagenome]|uniref:Asparagine synthetase [glutamine-hydrolyzing] n=1 Tax=hydrothermal vent metagenome TaxID=652676 RepID=A0A3B1AKD6_9ZZZZ